MGQSKTKQNLLLLYITQKTGNVWPLYCLKKSDMRNVGVKVAAIAEVVVYK